MIEHIFLAKAFFCCPCKLIDPKTQFTNGVFPLALFSTDRNETG